MQLQAGRAARPARICIESQRRAQRARPVPARPASPSSRTAAAAGATCWSRSKKRRRRRSATAAALEANQQLRATGAGRRGGRAARVRAARLLRHRPAQPRRHEPIARISSPGSASGRRTSPNDPSRTAPASASASTGIVGTYREPAARAIGNADVVVDRARSSRACASSFNFARKGVNADLGRSG